MAEDEDRHFAIDYVSDSDPGAVGVNAVWVDTSATPALLKVRNPADDGWLSVAGTAGATGSAGATGPQGPGGWQGTWVIGTTYAASMIVKGSDNHLYISMAGGNVGHDPTTDAGAHWQALAS